MENEETFKNFNTEFVANLLGFIEIKNGANRISWRRFLPVLERTGLSIEAGIPEFISEDIFNKIKLEAAREPEGIRAGVGSGLREFRYREQKVLTVTQEDEIWVSARAVYRITGIRDFYEGPNVEDRVSDGGDWQHLLPLGESTDVLFVNEVKLYEILLRFDTPDVVEFREWLSSCVFVLIHREKTSYKTFLSRISVRDSKRETGELYGTTNNEYEFGKMLSEALSPFHLVIKEQYQCFRYRIDFYIEPLKIAIEYDEFEHYNYSYEAQEFRQKKIERALGCRFIRISNRNSNGYNVGYVIKQVFKL